MIYLVLGLYRAVIVLPIGMACAVVAIAGTGLERLGIGTLKFIASIERALMEWSQS